LIILIKKVLRISFSILIKKVLRISFSILIKRYGVGWMTEWSKVSVLKTDVSEEGTGGSNPSPSVALRIIFSLNKENAKKRRQKQKTSTGGREERRGL
jgi:hypothetical protein